MSIPEQQMQELMEAGEHEYNDLMDKFNPPGDWQTPDWGIQQKVHNWRNYASNGLRAEWLNFTGRQRIIISANLEEMADREEWD